MSLALRARTDSPYINVLDWCRLYPLNSTPSIVEISGCILRAQVILYSGESLITRRPPPEMACIYTVKELCEKSSYSTFTMASEVAPSKFILIINKPNTL